MKPRFLIALVLAIALAQASALSVNVMTTSGPVVGVQEGSYLTWKGIPYASVSRFAPPVAPADWTTPRQTTEFGPCCPQEVVPNSEFAEFENKTHQAEDCLSLNIWSPTGASGLPVLVYIHGGAFVFGCSSRDRYHGSFIAGSTPTVVVTINYRLGVFGFLAGRELNGNYGIMDQQAALNWVQKNIAAFGGDPTKVTLDGQSAGAISVATHLTLPSTTQAPTFRAAILQSDPVLMQFRTLEEQHAEYDIFSSAVNCGFAASRLDCMRALPWQTLLASQNWGATALILNNTWQNVIRKIPWQPTIDGVYVTQSPSQGFQSGSFYKVPVMLGTVANETLGFLPVAFGTGPAAPVLGAAFYNYGFNTLFGESLANKVRARYPNTYTNSQDAVARTLTDFAFICPVLQTATWLAGHVPTYVYQFSHPLGCDPNNYHSPICNHHTCHSADVDFIFHTISTDRRGDCFWNSAETDLSWHMLHTWTNFTANPSTLSIIPRWTGDNVYHFDIPRFVSGGLATESNCDFWADVVKGTVH
jgi:carboxylesterase type B